MAEIRRLDPHDPVPETGRHVVLLRRFDEDDPHRVVLEMIVDRGDTVPESTRPVREDGTPMGVGEAIRAAREIVDVEKLNALYVIDRLAGPREREIVRHHGDHSINMGMLDDFDFEDGERGSDMRDRRP